MLIGLSLAKNTNKYKYPLEKCIRQHKGLFDKHIFVTPLDEQDYDDDINSIKCFAEKYGQEIEIITLDWPTELGFNEQSIDKKLLNRAIKYIAEQSTTLFGEIDNVWVCKHDLDEFFHEDDFPIIRDLIDMKNFPFSSISTNYIQLCGSYRLQVFDPTVETTHIFRLNSFGCFPGNDAMNVRVNGENLYLPDVSLYHTGYVKDKKILTTKIREHLILNGNIYGESLKKLADEFEFEFPTHCTGFRLWPLGIAVINGSENKTEYTCLDDGTLPMVLRESVDEFEWNPFLGL